MLEDNLKPLPFDRLPATRPQAASAAMTALRELLLDARGRVRELPALPDLIAALTALAKGARRKLILPLSGEPAEFALVRSGKHVLIDCYGTESVPEIVVRGREVELRTLLDLCVQATRDAADEQPESTRAQALRKLARKLAETRLRDDARPRLAPVSCSGGSQGSPGAKVPLAFGFSAEIPQGLDPQPESHAFADVHALLFEGVLWAFAGEKRVMLFQGPVMLAAQCMVGAVRVLCDAGQADRTVNRRLRSAGFWIAVRGDRLGPVELTFGGGRGEALTWPALDFAQSTLPILRLANDLLRKLIAVDRRQIHNLRVSALRAEIRALRRVIRARERRQSFENVDPERLRLSEQELQPRLQRAANALPTPAALRYGQRWGREVDGLDASTLYLCGEQIVIATPKLTLALARSSGDVLWSLPSASSTTLMAGRVLLQLAPDGQLSLHEVSDGSSIAETQLAPRTGSAGPCLYAAGASLPPMAILSETRKHLVAIDLRTGQPRFRLRVHGESGAWLARSGRVMLVTSAEGTLDAIDLASGEVVWRFGEGARFCAKSLVWRDVVVAVTSSPNNGPAMVHGIGLYSGKPLWRRELPMAVHGDPVDAGELVVVPCGRSQRARLSALDPRDGSVRWSAADPGLDNGARAIGLDGTLAINAPSGRAVALGLATGEPIWTRALANPLTDDVPRQLEPVLRQGALFVPSAQVHVLRPQDGTPLCQIGCDLVPDWLRVDERGWVYVAEESGHIAAYAAAPHLALVKK